MIVTRHLARCTNQLLKATTRRQLSSKVNVTSQDPAPMSRPGSNMVYNVPVRPVTMDDLMEPYGPWKQAYAAENKRANFAVVRGFLALSLSLVIFWNSGVVDGIYMPNLDNIMEETESYHVDKEGRITV